MGYYKCKKLSFYIFTYLWRSPHWSDVHEKLISRWYSWHNHVCRVLKWNFYGLRFYRESNFYFSTDFWMDLTTVQRDCAACDYYLTAHWPPSNVCGIATFWFWIFFDVLLKTSVQITLNRRRSPTLWSPITGACMSPLTFLQYLWTSKSYNIFIAFFLHVIL